MSKTEMNAKVSAEKKSPTVTVTITAVMVAFVFVVTYFLSVWVFIGLVFGASSDAAKAAGLTFALGELPFDIIQVVAGGIIGIPVARKLRAAVPVGLLPHRAPRPTPSAAP